MARYYVVVETDNAYDARDIVERHYFDEDIVLDYNDYDGTNFEVICENYKELTEWK